MLQIILSLISISSAHRYIIQVDYEKATDLNEDHTFDNLNVLNKFSTNGKHYLVIECEDHKTQQITNMDNVLNILSD
jgi:hypothetical protein